MATKIEKHWASQLSNLDMLATARKIGFAESDIGIEFAGYTYKPMAAAPNNNIKEDINEVIRHADVLIERGINHGDVSRDELLVELSRVVTVLGLLAKDIK